MKDFFGRIKIICLSMIWAVFLSGAFFDSFLWAQVSVEAKVDRQSVCAGESFVFTISISGDVSSYSMPQIRQIGSARVYGRGSSRHISYINGKVSNRIEFDYIIVPVEVGDLKIPPLEVKVNGRSYRTNPVVVHITKCSSSQKVSQSSSSQYSQYANSISSQYRNTDTFAVVSVNKKEIYVGEPIILTYTIYTTQRVVYKGFSVEPVFGDFIKEELPVRSEDMNARNVVIGGRKYVAVDVAKVILIPTKAGDFTISCGTLIVLKAAKMRNMFKDFFSDSFWDSFFDEDVFPMQEPVELKTTPLDIKVLPLPDKNVPSDFYGSVGEFSIHASVDRNKVEVGDSVVLTIDIVGTGPLNSIKDLKLSIDGARLYKSSSSDRKDVIEGVPTYRKRFEYIIIPEKQGRLIIPSIGFSYFSPKDKRFRGVKTDEITVDVLPSKNLPQSSKIVLSNSNARSKGKISEQAVGMSLVKEDIRFIKTKMTVSGGRWFWIYLVLWNLLGVFALVFWQNRRKIMKGISLRSRHTKRRIELEERLKKFIDMDDEECKMLLDDVLEFVLESASEKDIHSFSEICTKNSSLSGLEQEANLCDAFLFGGIGLGRKEREKVKQFLAKMIKLFVLILAFLGLGIGSGICNVSDAEGDFIIGNQMYQAGDYKSALENYLKAERQLKGQSPQLFFNIGNTYFRLGNVPMAFAYYIKAKKLSFLDPDISYNLNLCKEKLSVNIPKLEMFFLILPIRPLFILFSLCIWAIIFLRLFAKRSLNMFVVTFILGLVSVVLFVLILISGIMNLSPHYVVVKDCKAYSGPTSHSVEIAKLKGGLLVKGVSHLEDWQKVSYGKVCGWVKQECLEKV